MRDSNSRGVAPNTLSKSAYVCSLGVIEVCDLAVQPGPAVCEHLRTSANETRTETAPGNSRLQGWSSCVRWRCDSGGTDARRRAQRLVPDCVRIAWHCPVSG